MTKPRIATVWLDGCSGCHMSFLDLDEGLLPVLAAIDLVYSPIADIKEFPEAVDVTLVEGAISNEEDLHKIKTIRARTKILISLGDCAVTGNVPAMRNSFLKKDLFARAYAGDNLHTTEYPNEVVPKLLNHTQPLHEVVPVDIHIPGCPPTPENILYVLSHLLEGKIPDLGGKSQFG